MKDKIEIRFSKSAQKRRGCGHIPWQRLQAMMRSTGILMAGQHVEKVIITDRGIDFTTDKTGNQKG